MGKLTLTENQQKACVVGYFALAGHGGARRVGKLLGLPYEDVRKQFIWLWEKDLLLGPLAYPLSKNGKLSSYVTWVWYRFETRGLRSGWGPVFIARKVRESESLRDSGGLQLERFKSLKTKITMPPPGYVAGERLPPASWKLFKAMDKFYDNPSVNGERWFTTAMAAEAMGVSLITARKRLGMLETREAVARTVDDQFEGGRGKGRPKLMWLRVEENWEKFRGKRPNKAVYGQYLAKCNIARYELRKLCMSVAQQEWGHVKARKLRPHKSIDYTYGLADYLLDFSQDPHAMVDPKTGGLYVPLSRE